jgi:phospholipid/cholesterol/gamma-HCH transport system substrate-binding protein
METRANHALIGAFTLAVVFGAFAFAFWFAGAERPSGMRSVKVVFPGSVSGLSIGNAVLFNGVRVGSVEAIDLVADDPSHVYAVITVDKRVPVRSDTLARLEYTGLTGVASVGLYGGNNDAPPLTAPANGPPVLMAERSDFQDLIRTAQKIARQAADILDKGDKLLDENTPQINAAVKNVTKFSDALAANADGIKDFMAAMADVGRTIKPLTAKLESLASDTDGVVKAVDPQQIRQIVSDIAGLSAKLNAAANKVDTVLTSLNGFLTTSDNKGVFAEVGDAAKSVKRLADNTDARTRDLFVNLTRFSNAGLRQYEGLAADGRNAVSEITKLVKSVQNNPQQFLFGRK